MSDDPNRLEISAQDLMPSWVTNLEKSLDQSGGGSKARRDDREWNDEKDRRPRGKGQRGGGGSRGDGGPRRERDRGDRDRGDWKGGRGRKGGGGRRDRDGGGDRHPRQRPEEALPTGISVNFEPAPHAALALARHIRSTGRTYAVADLAKMVLSARDRYQVHFRSEDAEKSPLFFCPDDGSLWLSSEEAISHVLRSPSMERFYETEEISVEPPKGNFSVVAVCGFTGQILGPPNHHEYQMNVARLHRERFADMSLERYKSRIEMKRDEETIEKWKSLVSTKRQFRVRPEPLSKVPSAVPKEEKGPESEAAESPAPEPEAAESTSETETDAPVDDDATETPAEEAASESSPATDEENADPTTETEEPLTEETEEPAAENEAEAEAEADATEEAPVDEGPTETPAAEVGGEILTSEEALERHFRKNHADEAVSQVGDAVVAGNIPGRNLSRSLLALLKSESDRSRKSFPLAMIQQLCREFENAGLKFFKRGKKALHVSVARPRAIQNEEDFTERVREIVRFVRANPKSKVVDLLDALVSDYQKPAKGETFQEHHLTQAEHAVLADLRWLTMEGYVIEFPGSELVLGRMDSPEGPKPARKSAARKKSARKDKPKKSEPS
ncbi:MAG: hypothetical protein KDN19_13025, partial [Verrucomicrobiae bacterium]|nr:hypothetical protein [Verrucomicrobiae bacterium]